MFQSGLDLRFWLFLKSNRLSPFRRSDWFFFDFVKYIVTLMPKKCESDAPGLILKHFLTKCIERQKLKKLELI